MGAADGERLVARGEGGEGVAARDNGDAERAGGGELRVVVVDGGRADDEVRARVEVRGIVPHDRGDAARGEPVEERRAGAVAARDLPAEAAQQEGDAGHADAARADEVRAAGPREIWKGVVAHASRSLERTAKRRSSSFAAEGRESAGARSHSKRYSWARPSNVRTRSAAGRAR